MAWIADRSPTPYYDLQFHTFAAAKP